MYIRKTQLSIIIGYENISDSKLILSRTDGLYIYKSNLELSLVLLVRSKTIHKFKIMHHYDNTQLQVREGKKLITVSVTRV